MNASGREDAAFYSAVLERVAQRRWGRPEDLGGAAVFLTSPASQYVAGTTVVVDSGFSNSLAYRN